jgi:hypothetical protein
MEHAGVVEEDVEAPAERLQRLGDEALAVGGARHVGVNERRLTARLRDRRGHFAPSRLVAPRDRDLRALLGEE